MMRKFSTEEIETIKEQFAALDSSGAIFHEAETQIPLMQRLVGEWGARTFPKSTVASIQAHFAEEAVEFVGIPRMEAALKRAKEQPIAVRALKHAGTNLQDSQDREAADCFLLLLHYCHRRGISLEKLTIEKFEQIQDRKWDDGAERGYSKHVEPE